MLACASMIIDFLSSINTFICNNGNDFMSPVSRSTALLKRNIFPFLKPSLIVSASCPCYTAHLSRVALLWIFSVFLPLFYIGQFLPLEIVFWLAIFSLLLEQIRVEEFIALESWPLDKQLGNKEKQCEAPLISLPMPCTQK